MCPIGAWEDWQVSLQADHNYTMVLTPTFIYGTFPSLIWNCVRFYEFPLCPQTRWISAIYREVFQKWSEELKTDLKKNKT
jgi:hypothetical protein